MRSLLGLGLAAGWLASQLASSHALADWPQWLGPNRNGSSPYAVIPWRGSLPVLWRHPVGEGHSSPVVADGRVFLHTKVPDQDAEQLSAFEADTGNLLWQRQYPRSRFQNPFGNGPRSTPLVDGDRIYTVGVTGVLTCWSVSDGKQLWQRNLLQEFQAKNPFFGTSSSPLLYRDRLLVMVGGPNASIVAFNKTSGAVLWKSGSARASYSSPILIQQAGKDVAVFLTQQGLTAVDPMTGEEYWSFPLIDKLSESSTTPVLAGDMLVASSVTYGSVGLRLTAKRDVPGYEQVWHNRQLTCYFSTPIAIGDSLYLVTGSALFRKAHLRCVDLHTGKVRWTRQNVGKDHATLLRVGNRLLLLEEKGDLVLVQPDSESYRELARSRICGPTWAHPAISDGKLYVRDGKELMCVELPSDSKR